MQCEHIPGALLPKIDALRGYVFYTVNYFRNESRIG